MNECKKSRLMFDDAFFDELTHDEKLFLERHLEKCPKCRAELNQNQSMLSAITEKSEHQPSPDFWNNYTANLHQRMLSQGVIKEKKPLKDFTRRFDFTFFPNWALKGSAALILLLVGIFIGRYFFAPHSLQPPQSSQRDDNNQYATINPAALQKVMQRTNRFLDRSKVPLLSIENVDSETREAGLIDFPYQKKISKALLKEAMELKVDLVEIRQRRLKELVSELEIILLQIANIDSGSEADILELVGDGQYIRGMLFEIRINDIRWAEFNKKIKKGHLKNKWRKI